MNTINQCRSLVLCSYLVACGVSPRPRLEPVQAPIAAAAPVASVAPVSASATAPTASAAAATPASTGEWALEAFPLPGAVAPVSLDYVFYEAGRGRVWVPAGGTGGVAVFDGATRTFAQVAGFKTAEREAHGNKRVVGPSSGSIGNGVAYVGNRASQEVCAVDVQTLALGRCLALPSPPDGVEFVAATHEVWVTTPKNQALLVLDASQPGSLRLKDTIPLSGDPEGYAVDAARGLFFTNLEDKGSTLGIDLKTHRVKDTWNAGCSSDGPRGLTLDSARGLLFVACTDHVQALDMKHDGAKLGRLDTGAGVDNFDYVAKTSMIYAAAGKAGQLTVARVSERGAFSVLTQTHTALGARTAVADENGIAYVADPQGARLLVVRPSAN